MTTTLTVEGRDFPLRKCPKSGNWFIDKRTTELKIVKTTGISDRAEAIKWAKVFIKKALANAYRLASGGHDLEEVAQAYLRLPIPVLPETKHHNVMRLRAVIGEVFGCELEDVKAKLPTFRLWTDYVAAKHGGTADLTTPRRENISIQSTLRAAASVFAKKLDHLYEEQGICLDFANLRRVPSLPVPTIERSAIDVSKLEKALPDAPLPIRIAVGLALHAGLRSKEIKFCASHWIVQEGEHWRVVLKPRPDEGFIPKGKPDGTAWLSGLILDPEFGAFLASLPDGKLVKPEGISEGWFYDHVLPDWVRQFVPREVDTKAIHALRRVYAQRVQARFASKLLASEVGLDAARVALGHKSSSVTLNHYLATT
jgi:integrase